MEIRFDTYEEQTMFEEFLNNRAITINLIEEFCNKKEYQDLKKYLEITRKIYNK